MAARAASMLGAAALVVAAILASAQSTAGGCMQTLIDMSPCHNYITGNETTPPKSCCSQLAIVVSSKPECLCLALGLGLGNVNKTRAHGLPDKCGIPLSITSVRQ
ncbi:non-specific lipid-transfer protein 4.1-like [Triticum dicoccoides]|uniref:non-specific lipid-transfer protein 4.1-like n=1 Tax=Triticum dicoccoides TaxID=85692 RepID=UPI0018903C7A|nr:non-specific lipid-transfer protein 4.1-like [Triticum dicoccoides]